MLRFLVLLFVSFSIGAPAQAQDFFGTLVSRAQQSATQPYRKEAPVAETVSLGYDAYRSVSFRPESVLWREANSDFRVEFFPTGDCSRCVPSRSIVSWPAPALRATFSIRR